MNDQLELRLTSNLNEIAASIQVEVAEFVPIRARLRPYSDPQRHARPSSSILVTAVVLLALGGIVALRTRTDTLPTTSPVSTSTEGAQSHRPPSPITLGQGSIVWPDDSDLTVDRNDPRAVALAFSTSVLNLAQPNATLDGEGTASAVVDVQAGAATVEVGLQLMMVGWVITRVGPQGSMVLSGAGPTELIFTTPPGASSARLMWRTSSSASSESREMSVSDLSRGETAINDVITVALIVFRDADGNTSGAAGATFTNLSASTASTVVATSTNG